MCLHTSFKDRKPKLGGGRWTENQTQFFFVRSNMFLEKGKKHRYENGVFKVINKSSKNKNNGFVNMIKE